MHFEIDNNAMNYYCNCKDESIEDSLSKPVPYDFINLRFYQNILDGGLLPFDFEIDLQTVINKFKPQFPDIIEKVESAGKMLGLSFEGQISIIKDPITLAAMENLAKPTIKNTTNFKNASHWPFIELDKIEVNPTIYLQLRDDKNMPSGDLTILPLHLNYSFLAKIRRGVKHLLGWTQEIKGEFLDFDFNFGSCQSVARDQAIHSKVIEGQTANDDEDDDDDFDEDEEDEENEEAEQKKDKKPKKRAPK